MSFFPFDTNAHGFHNHPSKAPGFATAPDPFAAISRNQQIQEDDAESIDFDDTYDGLGDQLDEANDDFNDDTFGEGGLSTGATPKPVGKDFDFFGQTAKVSEALNEEQARFSRQQTSLKPLGASTRLSTLPAKPFKTGYEVYKQSGYIPDLKANADIWGSETESITRASAPQQPESSRAPAKKKMMSLEEVEASMRSQPKKPSSTQAPQPAMVTPSASVAYRDHPHQYANAEPRNFTQPRMVQPNLLSAHETSQIVQAEPSGLTSAASRIHANNPTQILQRTQQLPLSTLEPRDSSQPRQILHNATRQQAQVASRPSEPQILPQLQPYPVHSGPSYIPTQQPAITHPHQLSNFSAEARAAYLLEEEKRAKRNHKIFLLSKDNGLMTPQDKNFVTRVQLQQLMTATGTTENNPEASFSDDFYYQVHNQIRGGPRQNPHQPLSSYAQTYLFQTGGSQAGLARRQHRGGDTHVQRMEQQVQRAVEAAKLKPKNKQLVIQGSLGKISFSNANTPKPLLNIKRQDNGDALKRPQNVDRVLSGKSPSSSLVATNDRKAILRNIEEVYSTLMKMEDLERREPPPPTDEADSKLVQLQVEWRDNRNKLNRKLWSELKVMEPILTESSILHPFIAFLSYPKGKKSIPRIFRQIDQEQRLTILTMIVIQLNVLDVIRRAQPQPNGAQLPVVVREEVELFSQVITPQIFNVVSEVSLSVIIGLVGLILDHVNIKSISRTRVGLGLLTMLISRVEVLKQGESFHSQEWDQWIYFYNRLFDSMEPELPEIFPGSINTGQDEYVWRYLATSVVGANPDQQQRLVIGVKDRVMETVQQSKTLPPEMAAQKLANVNLFMRALGLDVDQLG